MELSGPWTSNELSASGQVFEFRLWAELTEQSRGSLHVFLPMSDRGIDALVHRVSDNPALIETLFPAWVDGEPPGTRPAPRSTQDGFED